MEIYMKKQPREIAFTELISEIAMHHDACAPLRLYFMIIVYFSDITRRAYKSIVRRFPAISHRALM